MSESDKPHFVWVRTHAGPQPQKWAVLNYGVNGRMLKTGEVLATHQLTDALYALPIDDLVTIYPPPPGTVYHPPKAPRLEVAPAPAAV